MTEEERLKVEIIGYKDTIARLLKQIEDLEKKLKGSEYNKKSVLHLSECIFDIQDKRLEQANGIIQKAVFQNICYNCDYGINHCNQCHNGALRNQAEQFLKEVAE